MDLSRNAPMSTNPYKSPFIILEDAVSPMQCEELLDNTDFVTMDVDKHGKPAMTIRMSDEASAIVHPILQHIGAQIEEKYGSPIHSLEQSRIQWMDDSVVPSPVCDNSFRSHDKWLRVHDRDLTATLFLVDFNDKPPFDGEFEVYGGKLEFPSHQFGFNPVRGTVVIHPSDPHFTHIFSPVRAGDLFVVKTFITLKTPLLYSPKNFPGSYQHWLAPHF